MKQLIKNIIAIFVAFVLLQGCTKEYQTIFPQTTDERVAAKMEELKTILTTPEDGWKGYIYTGTGPGFVFYMHFNTDGYVNMVSDFNETTGTQPKTSSYSLKGLQQPTLSFDTYSYIHLLADPSNSVNGGENGTGLISDFEFYLEEVSGDSVKLMGIKNNIPLVLVKASAKESAEYLAGAVGEIISATSAYLDANPYPFIENGNSDLAVQIDSAAKTFSFLYLDGSKNVVTLSSRFTYSLNGLYLQTPITLGNSVIEEIFWDGNNSRFYILVNGQQINFQSSSTPVIPLVYAAGYLHPFILVDMTIEGYSQKLPTAFVDLFNQAKDGVYNIEDYQLELIALMLAFDETNTVNMYYFIRNSTGTYRAGFTYTMSVTSGGVASFKYVSTDFNGEVIQPGLQPLLDYFKNNTFTMDYYSDPDFGTMGGVYPVETPGTFFFGFLE